MVSSHSLDLEFEGSMYIGIILSAILYGVYLTIYFASVQVFLTSAQVTRSRRIFYISFGGVLVFLNTIVFSSRPLLGQRMWIVHRDEVNPLVYYEEHNLGPWYFVVTGLAQVVSNSLTNALLIYRCYFVFESRIWTILVPVLCSIAFLALSISDILIFFHSPVERPFLGSILDFSALALNIAINITVTSMIYVKILLVARRTRKHTELHMSHPYTGIVAILVESTAPLTIISVLLIVGFTVEDNYWAFAGSLSWNIVMAITPQLIILRVAVGVAWNKQTSLELSRLGTIAFAPPLPNVQNSDGPGSPDRSNYRDGASAIRMQNNPRDLEAGLPEKSRDSLTLFKSITSV